MAARGTVCGSDYWRDHAVVTKDMVTKGLMATVQTTHGN